MPCSQQCQPVLGHRRQGLRLGHQEAPGVDHLVEVEARPLEVVEVERHQVVEGQPQPRHSKLRRRPRTVLASPLTDG